MLQTVIVTLLVLGSLCYAGWTLMPTALRRWLATAMLRWPLPERVSAKLQRTAKAVSGCGCDGCDHAPTKQAADVTTVKPLTFHPRVRR